MITRLLRLTKLARGLRLAKLTKVLDSLHLLLKCIYSSFSTLSWSVVILLMLQCITGMIMSQLVHDFIIDPDKDLMERHKIFSYYGTFSRSQITMFEVHLANFGPPTRILLDYCGEWYAIVFLAYRCLAGYAVLNVINAVFIQQTITIAQQDHDVVLKQKAKAAMTHSKNLRSIFKQLDTSGDGLLQLEELQCMTSNPELELWMEALEINPSDLIYLFSLLDFEGDRSITFEEFFDSATRIKGHAKSVDLLNVIVMLKRLSARVDALAAVNGFTQFSRHTTPDGTRPHAAKEFGA